VRALQEDSLEVGETDSTENTTLIVATPQALRGHCVQHAGADSLQPIAAVHFDATDRRKETGAC
jgi:hypothetical protein